MMFLSLGEARRLCDRAEAIADQFPELGNGPAFWEAYGEFNALMLTLERLMDEGVVPTIANLITELSDPDAELRELTEGGAA